MTAPYILVVDDEPDIRALVKEILEDEGYEVCIAENGGQARERRRERRPDLVLLDIWMPDVDGITLLKEWSSEEGARIPVIMMSGHGTVETAVEATRSGAYDFLEKPLSMAKLLLTVERALENARLQRENLGLRRRAATMADPIGRSPVMLQLREQVKRIAGHDTSVLINGEPGTGKEVIARYLHANSMRRANSFVDVAVASIVRENAAVELFGLEEGERIHYGHLEQARGGILFLNDIADMDLATQGRLLSALESRFFLRVGGAEPIQVNVRVVASTHHDLEEDVNEGRFREDLYYHLNVVPIRVPPLREHCEDVPDLISYYLNLFVNQEGLPYRGFSVAIQNRLRNHSWPGNVRELKNLVQRLLILGSGPEVELEELEQALGSPRRVMLPEPDESNWLDLPLRDARDTFEKAYLEHHLRLSGGNVARLAKQTGMERTHLYRKLRALGIEVRNKV
ncbi:Nitrogen assimilation regulatory protein NtrX [Gammaproteobacteria bacterium]